MTALLDQQFVAHRYAATDGPEADAARRALGEVWRGCGLLFGMTAPITGTCLPSGFPEPAVLDGALATGGAVALAAIQRPGTHCQAVLRLHHDVLNLSVALVPPEASAPAGGTWPWWRDLDYRWNLLTGQHAPGLLGEARLFLARVDAAAAIGAAAPELFAELRALLPGADGRPPVPAGVALPGGFAVWEDSAAPDDRAVRRLVIPIAPDADPAASAWAWSDSGTAIPPLCRYLLHAAKLRYELRVWRRDSRARQLGESLDSLSGELRRLGGPAPARQELLRLRRLDAAFLHADLLAIRQTVQIAGDNLGRAVDLAGLAVPGSLFADDAELARWLTERLTDEAAYLAIAAGRAERLSALLPPGAPSQPSVPAPRPAPSRPPALTDTERRRNVFVVYGRDDAARRAVFDFLRALGLNPLEWEEIVRATGKNGLFLSEAVGAGMAMSAAVVVLLTPDDVVRLHPDLHEPKESPAETADSMQPRPNVLLELGMALAAKPEATLILVVGGQRQVTDLGGMSYVRLTGNPECRVRISNRLEGAGCLVKPTGTDWLRAGDFAGLDAQYRGHDPGPLTGPGTS